jgi:membrane protein
MPRDGMAIQLQSCVHGRNGREDTMFVNFEMALTWADLIKRTARETMSDDAQGLASQLAYYFFLALFPALLCVLAVASFFPLAHFSDQVARLLGPLAPAEVIAIIKQEMATISDTNHGGLLTIGLLGALWSSSSAMVSVIGAMNRAYDIDESRPWWKVRLTAIALTVALAVFIVLAFGLILAGPQVADLLAQRFAFGSMFVWTWKIVQWPLAFIMAVVAIGLIYYFAPDAEQLWVWITPGSCVATILWLAGSLAFRFYAVNFGNYEKTYGAIGGVILLLLWFFLTGLAIVIGAEMNAEIEHASPWAKAPGEKVPGQKKKLGAAAARAYRADGTPHPPHPVAPPAPLALPAYQEPSLAEKIAGAVTFVMRWRNRTRE